MGTDIIGGADLPTAIFLVSRTGGVWLWGVIIALLAVIVYLILRRNRK